MGIFDFFTPTAPTTPVAPAPVPGAPVQQAAPSPAPPGNIPPATDPNAQAPAPGVVPNAAVVPVTPPAVEPVKDDSPLAEFSKLWDTPTIDPNAPAAPAEPVALTAEAIQKVVAKANFAGNLTPEVMTTITAGGEEGQKAMQQLINSATQQAVTQAIMASNKLNEKAITDALTAQQAQIPELLRTQAASDHLKTTNPLFNNPAVKPVIEATQAQLLSKFPTATPAEITKMTQDYVLAMGTHFAPPPAVNDNDHQSTDWSKFMEAP